MEEKNSIKVNLFTIILIILLLIIIIVCLILYKNQNSNTDIANTNDYSFNLDSENKYIITTDSKWKTMQNDGGSNTSIYYQIDLDNSIISKVQENYHANLTGSPRTEKNIIYVKKINTDFQEKLNSLLNEIITKEDINETHNYNFFTISSLNFEKQIYNKTTIENIYTLLEEIDK